MSKQKEVPVPFHLAFPVKNLEATKLFYNQLLGCPVGRISDYWVDFNFYGHQISAHLDPTMTINDRMSVVDGTEVPLNHFGVVLGKVDWELLQEKFLAAGIEFVQAPNIRHKEKVGEQGSMFIEDPSGNVLEFKYFVNGEDIFKTETSSTVVEKSDDNGEARISDY